MKISEYKTAIGKDISELDKAVNELLRQGFQPFGSPYMGNIPGVAETVGFFQAMVRQQLTP